MCNTASHSAMDVMRFGFGVLLVTLHHHYQSGRSTTGARGFEPLPRRRE